MKFIPSIAGEYRGAFGGLVASRNKGGQFIRRRAVPTNPATDGQEVVRAAMAQLVQQWTEVLTDEQRLGWDQYAKNTAWTDNLGQSIELQGVNEFVRSNVPRVQATAFNPGHSAIPALATIVDAPVIFDRGSTPVINTADVEVGATTDLTVAFTPTDLTATDMVFLYVSPPLNPTRNYWKGPYFLTLVQAGNFGGGGIISVALDDPDVTPWASVYLAPVAGQVVHLYLRVQRADGRLSTRVLRGPVPVADAA